MGGARAVLSGHVRWGNGVGLKGLYRTDGSELSREVVSVLFVATA